MGICSDLWLHGPPPCTGTSDLSWHREDRIMDTCCHYRPVNPGQLCIVLNIKKKNVPPSPQAKNSAREVRKASNEPVSKTCSLGCTAPLCSRARGPAWRRRTSSACARVTRTRAAMALSSRRSKEVIPMTTVVCRGRGVRGVSSFYRNG